MSRTRSTVSAHTSARPGSAASAGRPRAGRRSMRALPLVALASGALILGGCANAADSAEQSVLENSASIQTDAVEAAKNAGVAQADDATESDNEVTDEHEGHGDHASAEASEDASDDASEASGEHMHAMDGGAPPAGIAVASAPEHAVGESVELSADHMPGMDGAQATITGAFDTVTYAVSYEPTDGSAKVHDHKWVVQEELENPGKPPLRPGTEVTILADHMPGMEGAVGTIDSYTEETVYMVDVVADGMEMTNHKWVVESEIGPQE